MTRPEFFLTSMPSSRPADYYLGYDEGAVFIDFNNVDKERVCLVRISFDGYGCCNIGEKARPLDAADSKQFKEIIEQELDDQVTLLVLVKKALALNVAYTWQDALEEYGLI